MNHSNTSINTNQSSPLAAALGKAITPERIAATLSDALSATLLSRSGAVEIDTRSRLQAASLILAYLVGKPVERTETVNVNMEADSGLSLKERIQRSPALRAQLTQTLAEVEAEARHTGTTPGA
jgi:hypothetical protein